MEEALLTEGLAEALTPCYATTLRGLEKLEVAYEFFAETATGRAIESRPGLGS
jgi:hypothetical protein